MITNTRIACALAASLFLLMGCGSVDKMALNSTARLLSKASYEAYYEHDYNKLKLALPSQIKMIDGLLFLEPENSQLLIMGLKAYAAYGYLIGETEWLREKNIKTSSWRTSVLSSYTKSVDLGLRWLEGLGIERTQLIKAVRDNNGVNNLLNSKLEDKEGVELKIFFLAQSWGGLIQHQKKNPYMIAQLPLVKSLFDWSCERMPHLQFGACQLFYGAYETQRPKMLGGKPQIGKELFLETIKKYPQNMLARMAFIQYYAIPYFSKSDYFNQREELTNFLPKFEKQFIMNYSKNKRVSDPQLNLFNAVALERFRIIKSREKDFF